MQILTCFPTFSDMLSRDMSWSLLECRDSVCWLITEIYIIPNIAVIVASSLLLSSIAIDNK